MNDTTLTTLQIIDGIYDIQPLAIPAISLFETTLLSLLTISLIAFVAYFSWKLFFSKRSIATREMKKLHNQFLNKKISDHDAVYRLCMLTKEGLKLKHLNNNVQLPYKLSSKLQQWHVYLDSISMLRYQNETKINIDINKLINDSLFWLKVWP